MKFIGCIDFLLISTNETGTYPLQSIVETAATPEERSLIISKYSPHFKEISLSKYGNHIIEKSLLSIDFEQALIFFDVIISNFMVFACDQYGVKITKIYANGVISYSTYLQEFEVVLFQNLKLLINHEFGNYLIQLVIDNWGIHYCSKIVGEFHKCLVSLSINKYSSNVLEKLIEKLENVSNILNNIETCGPSFRGAYNIFYNNG